MAELIVYPSSNTDETSKGVLSNAGNAYSDDGSYMNILADDRNDDNYMDYSGFDFSSIPAGSTINSVNVAMEFQLNNGSVASDCVIQAEKSGVLSGSQVVNSSQPTTWTVLDTANTGTWTLSDLANLSVRIGNERPNSNTEQDFQVDYVRVTVDYTPAGVHGSVSSALSIAQVMSGIKDGIGSILSGMNLSQTTLGTKQAHGSAGSTLLISQIVSGHKSVYGNTAVTQFLSQIVSGIKNARSPPVQNSLVIEQSLTGIKKGIASTVSAMNIAQSLAGTKEANGTVMSEPVVSQTLLGIKSVSGSVLSSLELIQTVSGTLIELHGGSASTTIEITQSTSGVKKGIGSAQTGIAVQQVLDGTKQASGERHSSLQIAQQVKGAKKVYGTAQSSLVIAQNASGYTDQNNKSGRVSTDLGITQVVSGHKLAFTSVQTAVLLNCTVVGVKRIGGSVDSVLTIFQDISGHQGAPIEVSVLNTETAILNLRNMGTAVITNKNAGSGTFIIKDSANAVIRTTNGEE